MPTPNAYDTFNQAGALLIDNQKIEQAIDLPPVRVNPRAHSYTLKEKLELISENEPCLKLLHQGLEEEYLHPPVRSFQTLFPFYSEYRIMSMALILKAHTEADRGDWNASVNSRLDCITFGVKEQRGGGLIGFSIGHSLQSMGMQSIDDTIEHLNLPQTKAALDRLLSIYEKQVTFSEMMTDEKWSILACDQEVFRSVRSLKDWNNLTRILGIKTEGDALETYRYAQFMLTNKAEILNNYSSYMDSMIELQKTPYSTSLKMSPFPSDVWNRRLGSVYANIRFRWTANATEQQFLIAKLALHRYRLEHGAYPLSLAELAPSCLKTLPEDPFSDKKPLGYRVEGGKFTLYSIGPDGVDDGGKPIESATTADPKHPKNRHFYNYESESKGDVVSDVNTL